MAKPKKKPARGRSRMQALPTKFSMKGAHTALNNTLKRLSTIKTPRADEIREQIEKLMNDTQCPQGMVLEL